MPNIVACFKWVVDEAYIRRNAAGELDFSAIQHKLSDYDRNAIEEAVLLRELHGGIVHAVTAGVPGATKGIKDALSRGPDQALFLADPSFVDLEPSQTASLLAAAIRGYIDAYDLILCGEGSSDLYAQQVGPRLAENLGIPCVSFAQKLTIEGRRLIAERRVEEGIEIVEAEMPVVATVLPEINTPRIPGVKDTLLAAKKAVMTIGRDSLGDIAPPRLRIISTTAARVERTCVHFGADGSGIGRFVAVLKSKGGIS
jgi:electron transfer flavoprotein beta subunit